MEPQPNTYKVFLPSGPLKAVPFGTGLKTQNYPKTREFLLGPSGETNYYHVVSRVAGRELLFGDEDKEVFRILLLKQLKFSVLRALAWCFMGNHFHLLLEVPDKDAALKDWGEDDYIGRLGVLRKEWGTHQLLGEVEMCQKNGRSERISEIAGRVKERLFDLSMFISGVGP